MDTLHDLAAFLITYADGRRLSTKHTVEDVLSSGAAPTLLAKQAMLYGIASEISAAHAAAFNPAWKP